MKTLLENGQPHGDCTTAAGRAIAENLKSVKSNLRHGLARRAPDGAIEDAAMSGFAKSGLAVGGPAVLLPDGDIGGTAAAALIINGNLTGLRLAERQTKQQLGQTNYKSGARWKFAQEVGPAVDGAVTRSGGAHEQCYADN
jgi:dihydroxyacid dehydratase/phosphogluconate dehydratase